MATQVLILPGFSLKNREWAEELKDNFLPHFEANIHEWKHWSTGNSADFSDEDEVRTLIAKLNAAEGRYVSIVAKSIGTWIFAKLCGGYPNFNKVILCGIPFNDLTKNERDEYKNLGSLTDIVAFQNQDDSHGSFNNVKNMFDEFKLEIPLHKTPGDSHDYPYCKEFLDILS